MKIRTVFLSTLSGSIAISANKMIRKTIWRPYHAFKNLNCRRLSLVALCVLVALSLETSSIAASNHCDSLLGADELTDPVLIPLSDIPDAGGPFRQRSFSNVPRSRDESELEARTHYAGIDAHGETIQIIVQQHLSIAYKREADSHWTQNNRIIDRKIYPDMPALWTAQYKSDFDKPIQTGSIYTFYSNITKKYYTGTLIGYDPEDNFVIQTTTQDIYALNRKLLNLKKIVRGRSIPALHDHATRQYRIPVGLRFKHKKTKEGLFFILGFTDDGKVRVNRLLVAQVLSKPETSKFRLPYHFPHTSIKSEIINPKNIQSRLEDSLSIETDKNNPTGLERIHTYHVKK